MSGKLEETPRRAALEFLKTAPISARQEFIVHDLPMIEPNWVVPLL